MTQGIFKHLKVPQLSIKKIYFRFPGVGRGSSQSGSERESDEVTRGEASAPVPIPDSEELQRRKEEARRKRRRKKRSGSSVVTSCFQGTWRMDRFYLIMLYISYNINVWMDVTQLRQNGFGLDLTQR